MEGFTTLGVGFLAMTRAEYGGVLFSSELDAVVLENASKLCRADL